MHAEYGIFVYTIWPLFSAAGDFPSCDRPAAPAWASMRMLRRNPLALFVVLVGVHAADSALSEPASDPPAAGGECSFSCVPSI
jgi:hypothetical protein